MILKTMPSGERKMELYKHLLDKEILLGYIRVLLLRLKGYKIGNNVKISNKVKIKGSDVTIGDNVSISTNTKIYAKSIIIGNNSLFFENVQVFAMDAFYIGARCKISKNCILRAYNITIGNELWCNENLDIGGGGWRKHSAVIKIGDSVHIGKNVTINVCQSVTIGSYTGIGMETMIFTHSAGNGQSILCGYAQIEKEVHIGNHVSIFSRAFVLPGTFIEDGVILGAMALARKRLNKNSLYVGVPAVKKKEIVDLSIENKIKKIKEILEYELVYFDKIHNLDYLNAIILMKEKAAILFIHSTNYNSILSTLEDLKQKKAEIVMITFSEDKFCAVDITVINLTGNTISGITSDTSELLRDVFRRYGIILRYDGYIPYLIDINDLKKKHIEI